MSPSSPPPRPRLPVFFFFFFCRSKKKDHLLPFKRLDQQMRDTQTGVRDSLVRMQKFQRGFFFFPARAEVLPTRARVAITALCRVFAPNEASRHARTQTLIFISFPTHTHTHAGEMSHAQDPCESKTFLSAQVQAHPPNRGVCTFIHGPFFGIWLLYTYQPRCLLGPFCPPPPPPCPTPSSSTTRHCPSSVAAERMRIVI